ncbi:MAG: hypothetical protein ABIA76_05570 [Candidatus Diapherotrites archaeon]
MKRIIFLVLILSIALSGCYDDPSNGPCIPDEDVSDTGPEKACTIDSDCWCGSFNGACFIEGKITSECCSEENGAECPKAGYCRMCYYM